MSTCVAPLTDSRKQLGQNLIRPITFLLFALYVISAVSFILRVNHPVFDEQYHVPEIRRYATNPVTVDSIRHQGMPIGPGSFLWISIGGRLFGDSLWAYRFMVSLSWLLISTALLAFAQPPRRFEPASFALLFTLIFPHTPTAFATAITEGPSLLFAITGVLLWVTAMWKDEASVWNVCLYFVGALLVGWAAISRQYYIAILPGMAFLLLIRIFKKPPLFGRANMLRVLSFVPALLPLLCLLLVWGGVSSPSMAAGASIPGVVAHSGFNPARPIVTTFYICIYSLLLFWPALLDGGIKLKLLWFACGALVPWVLFLGGFQIDQLGPLKTILDRLCGGGISRSVVESILAGVGGAALGQVVNLLYQQRAALIERPLILLSIFTVLFFVAEQIAVGGNIPFYERYLLQIAPFLGLVRGFMIPRVRLADIAIWSVMAGVGQLMLWRYF